MNESGKNCPICRKDIGYWTLIKAPLPNMIHCQYCHGGLRYEKNSWKLFFGATFIYCLLIIAMGGYYVLHPGVMETSQALALLGFVSIFYWLATEILITHYLRNNQKLLPK